jgi:hypothetical protein
MRASWEVARVCVPTRRYWFFPRERRRARCREAERHNEDPSDAGKAT